MDAIKSTSLTAESSAMQAQSRTLHPTSMRRDEPLSSNSWRSPELDTIVNRWRATQGLAAPVGTSSEILKAGDNDTVIKSEARGARSVPAGVTGLRKWVGQVLAIDEDLISVELHSMGHEAEPLVADFPSTLLGADCAIAKPGSVVYLTTRFIGAETGYPEAAANLRLKRPRQWSQQEVSNILSRAHRRAEKFARYADGTPRQ